MTKRLFREYFSGWKWSGLGNCQAAMSAFVAFGFSLFMTHDRKDMCMELGLIMPILLVMLSVMTHPVRHGKMFYLCPMTPVERRGIVRREYIFRVIIHMLLMAAGLTAAFSMAYFNWLSLICVMINDVMICLLIPSENKENSDYIIMAAIVVIGVLINLVQLVIISNPENYYIVQIIVYIFLVAVEIPLFVKYTGFIRKELKTADYYEEMGD